MTKLKQFEKALLKAGLHASGKPLLGYRIVHDESGEVIKVKSVVMHNDPSDFTKEIILPDGHPKVQELKDKAELEVP